MFFRNLTIFRLVDGWAPTGDDLSEQLARGKFQPCGAMDTKSLGWAPPRENGALAHSVDRQLLIALRTEQKLLPASVVRKAARARAAQIEEEQGRKVGRKEMREITERVTEELLPRAFTDERQTMVWIDPVNRWMVVDGTSARADDVIEKLAATLDTVPVLPVRTQISPVSAMTSWLASGEAPASFSIDRDCELRSPVEEKATVKYARHALEGTEVKHHVEAGKQAVRLAMTFDDRVSFVLTDSFEMRRVAFLDVVVEQVEQQAGENADDAFDADFTIGTGELRRMLPALVAALGGEAEA